MSCRSQKRGRVRPLFWEISQYPVELRKNRPNYWDIRSPRSLGSLPYMVFCTFSVTITTVITGEWLGRKHGCDAGPGYLRG